MLILKELQAMSLYVIPIKILWIDGKGDRRELANNEIILGYRYCFGWAFSKLRIFLRAIYTQ